MEGNSSRKAEFDHVALDETRDWTKIKHNIVRKYAEAYSRILTSRKHPKFTHVYIDAFAGAGLQYDPSTHEFIQGSPLRVLDVTPRFAEYFFIDIDKGKIDILRTLVQGRPEAIHFYEGDCNDILLTKIFPEVQYEKFRRALCFIDPYGLDFEWKVIQKAGEMETIDLILNFSIMDANRNIFLTDPNKILNSQKERANRFWGDGDWRKIGYYQNANLFDFDWEEKVHYKKIIEAFRKRLRKIAGFKCVPEPIKICSTTGAPLYYLFFASQKPVAARIAADIFKKYRTRSRR